MTAENLYGTPVSTDPGTCSACKLARMLETGTVVTTSADAGHSQCEGDHKQPCKCGCEYARGARCKECGRRGTELDDHGQCDDHFAAFGRRRSHPGYGDRNPC